MPFIPYACNTKKVNKITVNLVGNNGFFQVFQFSNCLDNLGNKTGRSSLTLNGPLKRTGPSVSVMKLVNGICRMTSRIPSSTLLAVPRDVVSAVYDGWNQAVRLTEPVQQHLFDVKRRQELHNLTGCST